MEENYLTRSKIHTKALAVTMAMMVENGKADLMNYHGILHHWYKWIHINAPFYENLNYPSQGEHLEVTLAKLRTTFPAYTSYAKSLLNDLETIITLYNGNKDFFASLYKDRAIYPVYSRRDTLLKNKIVCVPSVFPRMKKALTKVS